MLRLKRSPESPEKEDELGALGWLEVHGETEPELSWGPRNRVRLPERRIISGCFGHAARLRSSMVAGS